MVYMGLAECPCWKEKICQSETRAGVLTGLRIWCVVVLSSPCGGLCVGSARVADCWQGLPTAGHCRRCMARLDPEGMDRARGWGSALSRPRRPGCGHLQAAQTW